MDTQSTPSAGSSSIGDLFTLVLTDGLTLIADGKEIKYRTVTLRETGVADERKAEGLSERAILVNGAYKLLVSESNFKHVLNMLHLAEFRCDQLVIPQAMITLDMYDKLSIRDMELIEERIFLLTLASEVRYGNMTQAAFDDIMMGLAKPSVQAPQRTGQAAAVGSDDQRAESGPTLLTDFAGSAAQGTDQSHGQPA